MQWLRFKNFLATSQNTLPADTSISGGTITANGEGTVCQNQWLRRILSSRRPLSKLEYHLRRSRMPASDTARALARLREGIKLDSLSPSICPHNETNGLFPYLGMEWKSDEVGGNAAAGELQAIRDGAAAVNSMHRFYQLTDEDRADTSPARSTAFSAVVTSSSSNPACTGEKNLMAKSCGEHTALRQDCWSEKQICGLRAVLSRDMREWTQGERLKQVKECSSTATMPNVGTSADLPTRR